MKIWLAANHKPVVKQNDLATWRRPRLIPFTQVFHGPTADPLMGRKLSNELPGILAWAVNGCLAWQKERLPAPEAVRLATAAYKNESDIIGAFLDDACTLDPNANVLVASLYDAYVAWCQRSGEREWSKKAFGIAMQERGFEQHKGTHGIRLWIGLSLKVA
jgi:putative DNA primase/helicase